ncbi:hypothetical protein HPP92_022420 [Vanilla planifolia]|uniref:O-fucosyltransferase family protein n=1 Tax=Vanilla planifolia TaxID=51239 RepID=A0A835PU28_VANPL|nr:hypothetical protein HPP92_022420 [Vanilla planifolia]
MGAEMERNPNLPGLIKASPLDLGLSSPKKRVRQSWISQKRVIPRPLIYGSVLFALGLMSLLTGHIVSDMEWAKFRQYRRVGPHHDIDIWKSDFANLYYGCSDRSPNFRSAVPEDKSNGYLLIATSGGLNQQRTGIIDAVIVAFRILSITLVIPELDHHSFWKDESEFANVFDVNWFISSLAKDVIIVKRVPDKLMRSMEKPPYTMRVPRKSTPDYYIDQVLPILLRRRVVQLTKFDYRLTNELDEDLQKLRCHVNYHALRFTKSIQSLGQKLVKRMQKMSSRYIAIHLRFEPDMLAFSGCYFGGGEKERNELHKIRQRWTTLPDLDEEVCDESDVFVTNNNGNMAKILAGRRRFMGHKRTIRPNAKKLSSLFRAYKKMEWSVFARKVKSYQRDFMGEPEEMRTGRGEFIEYPHSCICLNLQPPQLGNTTIQHM